MSTSRDHVIWRRLVVEHHIASFTHELMANDKSTAPLYRVINQIDHILEFDPGNQ